MAAFFIIQGAIGKSYIIFPGITNNFINNLILPFLMTQTPKSLGFRMPAEWERHEATWVAWPHDKNTWEDPSEIEDTYVEMIKALATGEKIKLIVNDEEEEKRAKERLKKAKVGLNRIIFYRVPNVDAWMRD